MKYLKEYYSFKDDDLLEITNVFVDEVVDKSNIEEVVRNSDDDDDDECGVYYDIVDFRKKFNSSILKIGDGKSFVEISIYFGRNFDKFTEIYHLIKSCLSRLIKMGYEVSRYSTEAIDDAIENSYELVSYDLRIYL